MFSPSLFKLLHLQSKNTYKHIQQTNKLEGKQKNRKNRNLPAGTWEIFIRGRVEGWISCISVVFVFLRVFLCFFVNVSFCILCFRLVFLSFCIYNRKNTCKNIKQNRKQLEGKQKNRNNRNLAAGTWEIFIRGRVEGWISCISVVFCFS